ncbi:unnamed protein product, partial [Rotaria sp. Silwood1]
METKKTLFPQNMTVGKDAIIQYCLKLDSGLGLYARRLAYLYVIKEIKQNIDGKQYLFNDQFTAADLTLTSLMKPLTIVPFVFTKYKSVFEYCDRIRERHDPKPLEESI